MPISAVFLTDALARRGARGERGLISLRSLSRVRSFSESLKGPSHEIDFKTFDKNVQNLA